MLAILGKCILPFLYLTLFIGNMITTINSTLDFHVAIPLSFHKTIETMEV